MYIRLKNARNKPYIRNNLHIQYLFSLFKIQILNLQDYFQLFYISFMTIFKIEYTYKLFLNLFHDHFQDKIQLTILCLNLKSSWMEEKT